MAVRKTEAGLSLGTNMGDRLAFLKEARKRIEALPDVRVAAASPVYETEPIGVMPQYKDMKFLNAVLIVEGAWTAHELYDMMQEVEAAMGRHRGLDRYAPRTIDIDLIYVGDARIRSGGLVIPHPRWTSRRFVLQPLADVRPNLVLPGDRRTVRQVLAELEDGEQVDKLTDEW
jgi:2-amino-4-hydroxy-6-hydroxymethyldihydropteridine diphosphokinase